MCDETLVFDRAVRRGPCDKDRYRLDPVLCESREETAQFMLRIGKLITYVAAADQRVVSEVFERRGSWNERVGFV